jgi:hypothetical protein
MLHQHKPKVLKSNSSGDKLSWLARRSENPALFFKLQVPLHNRTY